MIHVDSDSARCRRETKNRKKRKGSKKRELKKGIQTVRMTGHSGRQRKRKRKKPRHCVPKSMTRE